MILISCRKEPVRLNLVTEKFLPQLLEKGKTIKYTITDLKGHFEVEILRVDLHTKIPSHRHVKNWEIPINLNMGKIQSICRVGESHELVNDTNGTWDLLCIKGNNGILILPIVI